MNVTFLGPNAGLIGIHFHNTSIHFGVRMRYWHWLWDQCEYFDYFGLGPVLLVASFSAAFLDEESRQDGGVSE